MEGYVERGKEEGDGDLGRGRDYGLESSSLYRDFSAKMKQTLTTLSLDFVRLVIEVSYYCVG